MIEELNSLLEKNEIMVRVGSTWYSLDEIGPIGEDSLPIMVSDDDGESLEFDMADIDEFDPILEIVQNMESDIVGIA